MVGVKNSVSRSKKQCNNIEMKLSENEIKTKVSRTKNFQLSKDSFVTLGEFYLNIKSEH